MNDQLKAQKAKAMVFRMNAQKEGEDKLMKHLMEEIKHNKVGSRVDSGINDTMYDRLFTAIMDKDKHLSALMLADDDKIAKQREKQSIKELIQSIQKMVIRN